MSAAVFAGAFLWWQTFGLSQPRCACGNDLPGLLPWCAVCFDRMAARAGIPAPGRGQATPADTRK